MGGISAVVWSMSETKKRKGRPRRKRSFSICRCYGWTMATEFLLAYKELAHRASKKVSLRVVRHEFKVIRVLFAKMQAAEWSKYKVAVIGRRVLTALREFDGDISPNYLQPVKVSFQCARQLSRVCSRPDQSDFQ